MNATQEAKPTMKEQLDELRRVRDEIRLDLHLAGMDLRDEWRRIEKRLPDADQLKQVAGEMIDRLTAELRSFRDRLRSS